MTEVSPSVNASLEALVAQVADEFRERQKQGEQPDIEEYASRHPEAAQLLRKVLASLRLVGLSMSGGAAVSSDSVDEPLGKTLGDFQVIREIGRGGMGVVYEAEQLSLRRRVALKVLPFAAVMDPRQLQRFQNEARAAASLHHTNIVPVHAVGSERGVHYYAMEYIDGVPLSAVIQELRRQRRLDAGDAQAPLTNSDPAPIESASETAHLLQGVLSTKLSTTGREFFRTVAQLGEQAALALDHAHERGIVHRDIKPANLLLDGAGTLLITDFGLAQVQSDTKLTMTGDLLGTLRYMSPEQALAKRVVVDHRTDIYSLGATLYELFTLNPVFNGRDRQELLRQIAFEEPRPPRRLAKSMPVELETIVLKALEKNPADRYATAQELADDLQHYLEDRPILARRPTLWHRLRKWGRRHRAVVASALVALLVVLMIGVAAIERDRRRTNEAYAKLSTEQQKTQAVRDFLRNKLLAQADSRVQADALRKGGGKSAELKPNPTVRELLDRAALELAPDKIEEQFPGQPLVQAEILKTIGEAYAAIGEYDSAISHLQRARDLQIRELSPDHLDTLATTDSLAKAYLDDRKLPEATRLFQRVLDARREKLGADDPQTLASMNELTRAYFTLNRHEEVLKLREQVARLRRHKFGPDHPDTLTSMFHLANSYAMTKRFAEALHLHEETLERRKASLGPDHPDTLQSMNNVANCHGFLHQNAEALKLHEKTLDLRRSKLGADNPDTLQSMNNVAVAYSALGRHAEALMLHKQTLELRTRKLHVDHPDTVQSMNGVAWILANCPDQKLRNPGKALELAKRASELAPRKGGYWNTLGAAYYRMGDWKNTVRALTESMRLRKGGDATDWFFLAMAHWRLGDKDRARTSYTGGIEWMEKNKSQDEEHRQLRTEAAELLKSEHP